MIQAIYDEAQAIAHSRNGEIVDRLLRRQKQYHLEKVYACPYMDYRLRENILECRLNQLYHDGQVATWEIIRLKNELNELKKPLSPPCGTCETCIDCFKARTAWDDCFAVEYGNKKFRPWMFRQEVRPMPYY